MREVKERSDLWEKDAWNYLWDGDRLTAEYTCPNGHVGLLTNHDIKHDGTVSPSVVCPRKGCNFHDFIKLKGWDPNHKKVE